MAKPTANKTVNPLLKYFAEKEADFEGPRSHECPIYGDTFYFLHSSLTIDKVCNNDKNFKTDEEKVAAKYWALACDEEGTRYCQPTRDALIDAVKKSMGRRGFRDHCTKALIAMNELSAPEGSGDSDLFGDKSDDDLVDSDIEGTFEHEKKPLSSTEADASQ